MPGKSLLDVKHKRLKQKRDAKKGNVAAPEVAKEKIKNPTGKNGLEHRKANRGGRQLFDWGPVEERYVKGYERPHEATGEMARYYPSVMELSQELGIGYPTLSNRCTTDGWAAKREAWQAKMRKAKDDADLQALQEAQLRIRRKALKGAEAIIDRITGTEAVKGMVDAADPDELSKLAGALRRGQEVANVAIGIPKDGVAAPRTDEPNLGADGLPVSPWAVMRGSRQKILVGVSISTD